MVDASKSIFLIWKFVTVDLSHSFGKAFKRTPSHASQWNMRPMLSSYLRGW